MDKIYKVYRIDHKIEGEIQAVYIGYTSQTLRRRLSVHLHDKTCRFGRYWLVYTSNEPLSHRDELTITELASTDIKADAIALEEEQTEIAIKVYGDKCLNSNIGNRHSEETKKKISGAHKGKKLSDETKEKLSKAKKGSKHPNTQSCEYNGRTFNCIKEAYWYAQSQGYTKCYDTFKNMIKKQ